jgi:hypothetical protein
MEHRELKRRVVWVLWRWHGDIYEQWNELLETETDGDAIAQVLNDYGTGAEVLAVLVGDYDKEQTESIGEILTRRPRPTH